MAIYVITLKEFFAGAGEKVKEGGAEFWDVFHFVHPDTPVVRLLDHIHQDAQVNWLHILWQIPLIIADYYVHKLTLTILREYPVYIKF